MSRVREHEKVAGDLPREDTSTHSGLCQGGPRGVVMDVSNGPGPEREVRGRLCS